MIIVEPASNGRRRISKSGLTKFLLQAQIAVGLAGEVNVLLAGNSTLHRLNLNFRKKNKPTDVLSFPAPKMKALKSASREQSKIWAGDLAISVDIAHENARCLGHTLEMELKILLLHGLLHLAGYDHETDDGRMERRERLLQRKLGLSTALIERTAGAKKSLRRPLRGRAKEPQPSSGRRGQSVAIGGHQVIENSALQSQVSAN